MGEKLVIGPFDKGVRTNREPFYIDNDNFPVLSNAYQWRGRAKRKRGTFLLCRLVKFFDSITANTYNILSGRELTSSLVPGDVVLLDAANVTWTDTNADGILYSSPNVGTALINYSSGLVSMGTAIPTLPWQVDSFGTSYYNYYPGLPVLGIRAIVDVEVEIPPSIAFDQKYTYQVTNTIPAISHDVSYYINVPSNTYTNGSQPNIAKTRLTPTKWNGNNYQQYWTINDSGVMFITNGVDVPFTGVNLGLSMVTPTLVTWVSTTKLTFTIPNTSLIVNDFVQANEFTSSGTPTNATCLNLQTGYIVNYTTVGNNKLMDIIFPNANIPNDTYSGGILLLITKQANTNVDTLRWYDGNPTNNQFPLNTNFDDTYNIPGLGYANFQPPLSQNPYSFLGLPLAQYYLIGATMIFYYRDRLIAIGPIVSDSANHVYYLYDAVIYSQNGTPYYTSSFSLDTSNPNVLRPTNTPLSMVVPNGQSASVSAWFLDQTGFAGARNLGIDEVVNTASLNESVLILGTDTHQVRMVGTSNSLTPFLFYIINSELGSSSTFSVVNLDKGVMTRGSRGFVITSQIQAQRFDLDIPDSVFQIYAGDNGIQRVCAARDFINEWIYFSYPGNFASTTYNNFTLFYNYRDQSWAPFYETFTTYGPFSWSTALTWETVGLVFPTWSSWNQPWNTGSSTSEQPEVACGTQHGFVLVRDEGTEEGATLFITSFSNGSQMTVYDHCLNTNDFIIISGCLGSVGQYVNQKTFFVIVVDNNTLMLNPTIPDNLTYIGNGIITRRYVPFIQTKQFPLAWSSGRKTRIGVQQYLLTTTNNGSVTLLIYLSQNGASSYNAGPPPIYTPDNDALLYSTTLYTCPEGTNLGLTPANANLQMPTASQQAQIWHRINNSLIGDTVQLGITLSSSQMTEITPNGASYAITGATNTNPCQISSTANLPANSLIQITGVLGESELNFNPFQNNLWQVLSSNGTIVVINADATAFGSFVSGGTPMIQPVTYGHQTEEIELHGIIIDVTESSMLS